jgi:hypothetical protein
MPAETGPNGTASATTQSCANPVSRRLRNSLYLSGALARETREGRVSVGRNRQPWPKIRVQSLASPNSFPAGIGRADERQVRLSTETGSRLEVGAHLYGV